MSTEWLSPGRAWHLLGRAIDAARRGAQGCAGRRGQSRRAAEIPDGAAMMRWTGRPPATALEARIVATSRALAGGGAV
jgi:hypothetical protein